LASRRNKYGRGRAQGRQAGQLRIIGGAWRSRRIRFPVETGIRPTPDRVRETLFNWLQEAMPGARCLDLFAGSGALGFEALSRGAARVVFVDEDVRVIQQLEANIALLGATGAQAVWRDALEYLDAAEGPFDVVFLDPPFRLHLVGECCRRLERQRLLASPAWVYAEADSGEEPPALPPHWALARDKVAGQVAYRLYRREAPGAAC
jgi:16S rRNA (guanine966-N2)-methyltransferase